MLLVGKPHGDLFFRDVHRCATEPHLEPLGLYEDLVLKVLHAGLIRKAGDDDPGEAVQ